MCRWLGLVEPTEDNPEAARASLEHHVPKAQGPQFVDLISQLARERYDRALAVDIHDTPEPGYPMEPEVRKLKYLLESLV